MRVNYIGKVGILHGEWEVLTIVRSGEIYPAWGTVNDSGQDWYICRKGGPHYVFSEDEVEIIGGRD